MSLCTSKSIGWPNVLKSTHFNVLTFGRMGNEIIDLLGLEPKKQETKSNRRWIEMNLPQTYLEKKSQCRSMESAQLKGRFDEMPWVHLWLLAFRTFLAAHLYFMITWLNAIAPFLPRLGAWCFIVIKHLLWYWIILWWIIFQKLLN